MWLGELLVANYLIFYFIYFHFFPRLFTFLPLAAGRPPSKPKAMKAATARLELTSPRIPLPGKKRGRKPGVSYLKRPAPAFPLDDDLEPGQPRKSHRACVLRGLSVLKDGKSVHILVSI